MTVVRKAFKGRLREWRKGWREGMYGKSVGTLTLLIAIKRVRKLNVEGGWVGERESEGQGRSKGWEGW